MSTSTDVHVQKALKQLRLPPDEVGPILAWFLNGRLVENPSRKDSPVLGDRDAVGEWVRHLQKLETLIAPDGDKPSKREFEKTLNWINSFLKRYIATPALFAESHLPTWNWGVRWTAEGKVAKALNVELLMLDYAVELVNAGRISSLKRCETCDDWLFAKTPHKKFCRDECRERFHSSNEADKKRRRDWARKNYWRRRGK